MFSTPYNRPPSDAESNSGELLVERVGYISAQKRIENMILAGQRLKDFRSEQFDFPDENSIQYDFDDPTRSKGFDLADATQLSYLTEQKIKNVQKNAKSKPEIPEIPEGPVKPPEPAPGAPESV